MFSRPGDLDSNLPETLTSLNYANPDILTDPLPSPAVLVATELVFASSADGFEDWRIVFRGARGEWRTLSLGGLGLPASEWDNPDGLGRGSLSPDGKHWVLATQTRLVVVNLLTGDVRNLYLPGRRKPLSPIWSGKRLVVGTDQDSRHSYIVDTTDASTERLDVPPDRVLLHEDGGWWEFPARMDPDPTIRIHSTDGQTTTVSIPPYLAPPQGSSVIGDRFAVFVDSLVRDELSETGSQIRLVTVGDEVEVGQTLAWPRRRTGDDFPGWVDASTLLLRQANRMCVWQPKAKTLDCLGPYSPNLSISFATKVVKVR